MVDKSPESGGYPRNDSTPMSPTPSTSITELFSPRSPPFSPLNSIALKKSTQTVAFSDNDIDEILSRCHKLSCRERMRQLDNFHLHKPHNELECKAFNLPNHRINLHSLKEVMNLCGGLVGARFSSEEIRELSSSVQKLEHLWFSIDLLYKEMNTEEHRSFIPELISEEETKVSLFHKLADEYMSLIKYTQIIVKSKQLATLSDRCVIDVSNINQDPESAVGSPYPKWFITLKDKFEQYRETHKAMHLEREEIVAAQEYDKMKFTLGRFSVFLSNCLSKSIESNEEEWEALLELYDASADSHSIFQDLQIINSSHELHNHYLCSRLFNFLKSIPELKSLPREEEAVKKMKFID